MDTNTKNYKAVYTIVERQRDAKKFWLRVGTAFENRDGSLNIYLDAVPTNGTLQVRDPLPVEERDRKSPQTNFAAAS
jgi:hypothetical protein